MGTDDGFGRYVQSLKRKGRLDHQTERRLAERWVATRDLAAGRAIIETHLLFVVKIAHGFRRYGLALADLVAEGNIGLMEALERFDPSRNVRFISYAVWWIRAFMLAHIQRHWSIVHGPLSNERAKLFFKLNRARARVMSALGGTASPYEIEGAIAASLRSSRERVREMSVRLDERDVSLDAPRSPDGADPRVVTLVREGESQEEGMLRAHREHLVRATVKAIEPSLPPRERYILRHRLLSDEPARLGDISRHLGVSRERVRQLELRVKQKLQRALAELAPDRKAA
jgi:RNA polymerase sigma-32 factor